jgi:4,5:9,10-diseco-3-hydroxy-5,9,17-trioxoandrosta-1(10),2-diene-4-oate hydrolase
MPPNNGTRPVFSGMEERWAAVSGGRKRYLVGGGGPPLVLVHGIAASSFSFRLSCEALMGHFQVFVPDLMNVGYSDRVPGLDASLRGTAERMREFLDGVGIGKANILGSSHGGSVVMELAAIAPEHFERMILVSPANPFAGDYERLLKFYLSVPGNVFMRLAVVMPGPIWDYGIGRMYADSRRMVAGTGIGYARPLRLQGTVPHILSCLKTLSADIQALRPRLETIKRIPSLIVWGDRDPVVELQSAHKLQRALEAEMAVMPGVGHLPYEETPEEFNRIVLDYLRKPLHHRDPEGRRTS